MLLTTPSANAFSLLGPYESWMQQTNDFRFPVSYYYSPSYGSFSYPGDIGGPLSISNGYRWNVPIVTYGFDPSFTNFFGSNGIATVEAAIQMLNDLPGASSIVVTNYPDDSVVVNDQAQDQSLLDLRSVTLSLLVEQLGLASPYLSIFVLQNWLLDGENLTDVTVLNRSFDSITLSPSSEINGIDYTWDVWSGISNNVNISIAVPYPVDEAPYPVPYIPTVADKLIDTGEIFSGFTFDDAGGLRYLYSSNNINFETLLPGVTGAGTNSNAWVNGAWRPGVEKVTFVRHPYNSVTGQFIPTNIQYLDTYLTNGNTAHQQLQRAVSQPDFLFLVGDPAKDYSAVLPYTRTGTSNWINNASLNGNGFGPGPGVIQPPIQIAFAKLGAVSYLYGTNLLPEYFFGGSNSWASFDQSTNPPILFPSPQSQSSPFLLRVWYPSRPNTPIPSGKEVELSFTAQTGKSFVLQTSTNLLQWIPLQTNANNGTLWTVFDVWESTTRFYRIVPE